jgi:hypothetical protein
MPTEWALVMRKILVSLAAVLNLCLINSAQAERKMFIIANDTGYGVDRCLSSGDKCGTVAANSYCKSHDFAEATSFRKVNRDDITGAIPGNSGGCKGPKCDDFVAIVCTR